MAFDPTTAALVEEKSPSGGFDPSTAKEFDPTSTKKDRVSDTTLSELITGKQKPTTTAAGTFVRSGAEAAAATPAALLGARAGFALAPPVAPIIGPFSKPVGGIVGGIIGGFLGAQGIDAIEGAIDSAFGTNIRQTKAQQQQEHPVAALAGQVTGGAVNPWMKVGMAGSVKQAAGGAAIMTGVGAGMRAAEGGDVLDPKAIVADVVSGALTKPTARGERLLGHTTGTSVHGDKPKTPEVPSIKTGATPEQQAAFLAELKANKTKKDNSAKVVQTAIKNKETGEIELHGPKHNEARKTETADTHEQGFVDENGNFLNRKQAWERAKNTGQIPEGQNPEFPQDGLHSGDMRKAGVKEFDFFDVPDTIDGVPVTRNLQKTRPDGTHVGATSKRDPETGKVIEISINPEILYKQFDEKPWTQPKVEGVEPLPEDAFKTPQEWVDFVLQHEAEHVKTPKAEGQTKGQYEDQINKSALKYLEGKKAAKEAEAAKTPPEAAKPVEEPVDRTKTDPRTVRSEEEFKSIAQEIYEKSGDKAALEFLDGYNEYKKTWLEPVKTTEEFVGTNLRNKLADERVTSNNTEDIKKLAGNEVNLEELTYSIDKGETLTGKAKQVADKFRSLMDDLGKRALENGVIKGWHENYVARNVVAEGAVPPTAMQELMAELFGHGAGGTEGSMRSTTKYGKERRLDTREDLVAHLEGLNKWLADNGKDYRFKLKTDNLAEIYKDYAHAVQKAIENKKLIENIQTVRNANGESLIRPITKENPQPPGWETMEKGEMAGYAIHPDLVPALKFVFDAGPGDIMKALGMVSQVTKRINVIGSFFHAKSLMEVMSSAQIPVWTPLKEAVVLPLVEKGIKATTGKDVQLSAISKAVDQYHKGGVGDNVDKWIKQGGLQLEVPEDVSQGLLSSLGKFADNMIGKYGPKTRVLESSLSTVEKYTLGLFDKYTWDYLHTGGKIMVADAYLDKARLQAAKEGKPFDEAAARTEISKFVNDSFGGLNWFDAATQTQNKFAKQMAMAAYSPEGRRGLQMALFAPDWTISTLRAFSSALPKGLNPAKWHPVEGVKGMMAPTTKADYARLYQFKTALTYLTLLNAINMMTANRPIWDNKDPTRVEWPDGTSMQAMKHAMEPMHWLADPDKTLSNKLGFIPKAVIVGVGGLEYASPRAQKLADPSAINRLKAIGGMITPFQIQAATDSPPGEGLKRAALGTMGLPVYGSTAAEKKAKRAERELITKETAWEYRDKEIQAGRMPMTSKHREEGNKLRKRRQELERKAR